MKNKIDPDVFASPMNLGRDNTRVNSSTKVLKLRYVQFPTIVAILIQGATNDPDSCGIVTYDVPRIWAVFYAGRPIPIKHCYLQWPTLLGLFGTLHDTWVVFIRRHIQHPTLIGRLCKRPNYRGPDSWGTVFYSAPRSWAGSLYKAQKSPHERGAVYCTASHARTAFFIQGTANEPYSYKEYMFQCPRLGRFFKAQPSRHKRGPFFCKKKSGPDS